MYYLCKDFNKMTQKKILTVFLFVKSEQLHKIITVKKEITSNVQKLRTISALRSTVKLVAENIHEILDFCTTKPTTNIPFCSTSI